MGGPGSKWVGPGGPGPTHFEPGQAHCWRTGVRGRLVGAGVRYGGDSGWGQERKSEKGRHGGRNDSLGDEFTAGFKSNPDSIYDNTLVRLVCSHLGWVNEHERHHRVNDDYRKH